MNKKGNGMKVGGLWLAALAVVALAGSAYLLSGRRASVAGEGVREASAIPAVQAAQVASVGVGAALSALPTNDVLTVRGTKAYVVTSVKPIQKSLRLAIEAMGARTVSSLSRNQLLVEATNEVRARLAADSRFEEVAEFAPSRKIQPELAALIKGGATSVDVSLVALSDADRQIVISCLERGGGEMLKGCINEGSTIRAKLPADLVASLAARGDVRWMEQFKRPQLMNDIAVTNIAMNVQDVWNTSRDLGLTGAGQAISTSDTGIDTGDTATMHRDLAQRVKDIQVVGGCYDYDKDGHGTHTAGSIVGDGTESGGQIKGTAYGADLYAWFCSGTDGYIYTPSALDDLYRNGGAWGAFIHSGSWGSAYAGKYITECAEQDQYVWENPEFLPVFSAGNEGKSGSGTICSPAIAKNVLAVGATQNARQDPEHLHDGNWGNGDPTVTAGFSSRGPCQDGRIKPDIAAPGVGIVSTRSRYSNYETYGLYEANTNYAFDSGTSMSCPLTAGSVALVRQWLIEKKHFDGETEISEGVTNKLPTAALMKAVIMGGASGGTTPNNGQGWGRVNLADTLAPTNNGCAVKLVDRIPFAENFYTNIVIETTNAAPLDVQLVWIDYPGDPDAEQSAPKLVNDLDLQVIADIPGETDPLYGNGGEEPDSVNNAESVRITKAKPATYYISVNCKTILHDHTEGGAAALYIRGAFDPSVEGPEPENVWLQKRGRGYLSLNRALSFVTNDNEVVEIRKDAMFDGSVTLTNSCTIVATNVDASASIVTRYYGAALTVAEGVTLTMTNVAFAASTDTLVKVKPTGCLTIGERVDLGVDEYNVAVSTAEANGFVLEGALTRRLRMHCDAATKTNQVFGLYKGADAAKCATDIICADDPDRSVRGWADPNTNKLVWQDVGATGLPVDEASDYFYIDGVAYKYARHLKGLPAFKDAFDKGKTSELIVRRDGDYGLLFDNLKNGKALTIRGEGTPQPVLTASRASGFRVYEGGELVLANVVFSGFNDAEDGDNYGFIAIEGGKATLEDGAELRDMIGRVNNGSGIVDVRKGGTFTMREGSAIVDCSAEGFTEPGLGGAIYVYYDASCTLNLEGGTITGCSSNYGFGGGGVYVDNASDAQYCPQINLSGDLHVWGNYSDGNTEGDDICLCTYSDAALSKFKLVGPLSLDSEIGILHSGSSDGNKEGKAFITYDAGIDAAKLALSANCFFSDANTALHGIVGEGNTLVWKAYVYDGTCDKDYATVHVVQLDGTGHPVSTNYYLNFETAIHYMPPNTMNLVVVQDDNTFSEDVSVADGCRVTVTSDAGATFELSRYKDTHLTVPAGTSLTLTNIVFSRQGKNPGTVMYPLFDVCGGSLTLADGAAVTNILGNSSRDANAITVYDGGDVTMLAGSVIRGCQNPYNYKMEFEKYDKSTDTMQKNYGCGGGLLVDNATAYLHGGKILGCVATRGGGVYACNGSTVYVSGDMKIVDNKWQDEAGKHNDGNVHIVDEAELVLDGPLTAKIGAGHAYHVTRDTNIVATVAYDWTRDLVALTNSAAQFTHDATGGAAVAVTNETDALIVWCGAVKARGGTFTTQDGDTYALAGVLPEENASSSALTLLPTLTSEGAVAGELGKLADETVGAKITSLESYNAFAAWADKVEGGKKAVAESANAYTSYAFGATELFEEEPVVEITEVTAADGNGLTVKVAVKDGDDPKAVASEQVKKMFEATSDVGDWSKSLPLTVTDISKTTGTEVSFTVKPADETTKAFIRLKY